MRYPRLALPVLVLATVSAAGCATAHLESAAGGRTPTPRAEPVQRAASSTPSSPATGRFSLFPDRAAGAARRSPWGEPAAESLPVGAPPAILGDREWTPAGPAGTGVSPFAGFGRTVLGDAAYVLKSPFGWDGGDWLKVGLATAGVAAMMHFDESIAHRAQAMRTPASDRVASAVEPFGELGAFGVIGGFYLAGSVLHDDEAKAVAADGIVSSIIAAGIVTPLIKAAVGRSRPSATGGEEDVVNPLSGAASFPSGHTAEAFAVASVIATHYDTTWVKALSYGLASLVGLARIDHNAHFASDVLAGALIGTVVGQTVVHLDDERRGSPGGLKVSAGPFYTRSGPGIALNLHF